MSIKSKSENVLRSLHEIEPEAWVTMIDHPKLAKTSRYSDLNLHLKMQRNLSYQRVILGNSRVQSVALLHQNKLMGWGGFQPNQNQAELALVLHPNWWGLGKACFHCT